MLSLSTVWCNKRTCIVVLCLFISVTYYFYSTHKSDALKKNYFYLTSTAELAHDVTPLVIPIKRNISVLKDIACHKIPESVLKMADRNYTPENRTIFFIETSCKGGLNSRQACAVESAARKHPDRFVRVLLAGPLKAEFINERLFSKLGNVEFIRINVTDYAKGTPLDELFSGDRILKSQHPVVHSSDMLRILTLYKYGGLYLDLDVIVMKSFNSLPNNFVTKESNTNLASGILSFSTDKVGRHFLELAVRDLAATYNPEFWAENGPALILRTLRKICSVQDLAEMSNSTCNGVHVLDSNLFFPIYYPAWRKYFADQQPEPTDAYTHHVWNALGHDTEVPENSLYARLAQMYCPGVYELYGDKFGL